MRNPKSPYSFLKYPINAILGSDGNVRVLRTILTSNVPIGVGELARQTGLQRSGVARICVRLEDLGVIEAVGRGARNRQYQRAPRSQLANQIGQLFSTERARADAVVTRLRDLTQNVNPRAAWIQGPVARGTDGPNDPIVVGVLVSPADVASVSQHLQQSAIQMQGEFDVVVELRVVTTADLATKKKTELADLRDARSLSGPLPLDLLAAEQGKTVGVAAAPSRTHSDLDVRGQAIGRAIAERIKRDPSLVEEARHYIERRLPLASPGESLELTEWQQILERMSIPKLRRFLVADDERAVRLRQSLPFLHALSPEDRKALLAEARKA